MLQKRPIGYKLVLCVEEERMNEETIKNELQKYNVTDAAIAKLNADYTALTVKDATDDNGYNVVKSARMDVVHLRGKVEKTRVTLKAESLEYGRRIDKEAKRITALLEPIETHLIGQEKIVEDEKARIKAEAETKEAARIQTRVDTICAFGATFNGQMYTAFGLQIPSALVKACTDEEFAQFVAQVQEKKVAEDSRLKAEEDARKVESERLAKIAAEQLIERQRLLKIAEELETTAREIDARVKLEAEQKQKILDDAKHAEEIEKAKQEAAEKARIETEAKIKREADEKAEKERLAKIAAEKKEARRPDKERLLAFAKTEYFFPDMKTAEGKAIIETFKNGIAGLTEALRKATEAL